MDVLSDVISVMRTGRPHSARTDRHPPWSVRHPAFPGAGIHVVLRGTCRLTVSGGEPFTVAPGDVVLLPHGSAHTLADAASDPPAGPHATPSAELTELHDDPASDDPASNGAISMLCAAYLLDRGRPHPLLGQLPDAVHIPARPGRHRSLRATVDQLGTELERLRPGAGAIRTALLDALLVYLLRAWFQERSDHHLATGWAAALHDPATLAALDAIHADPARRWTVDALAARAGLSRAAFSRRFTATLAEPPITYLTWWRMTLAARRLRDSDLPLAAVAEQVGYGSEFAFAGAFKREYGTAPGTYRKRSRESAGGPR